MNNYEDYLTITSDGLDVDANNIDCNCITSKNNTFSLDSNGNLTVNTITINDASSNPLSFEAIFNRIYPVGSIYISVNNTNPGILFTGTWEKVEGRFLLGSNQTHALNSTGGEEEHSLTVGELPAHTHKIEGFCGGSQWASGNIWYRAGDYSAGNTYGFSYTNYEGNNVAHNNMPPYLTVNIWKRIS